MALRSYADGALFAEVLGEGAPRILALHGWGRRGADFRAALSGLPALALDLPGFGASPAPRQATGAAGYSEAVSALLEEFESPAIIVGHSFGGRVAMHLAVAHPERVGMLALTGVPLLRLGTGRRPSMAYRAVRLGNRIGVVPDEVLERRRRSTGSADYRAATGVMRDVLVKVVAETYETELATAPQPLRLLWGEDDREVPVEVARRAVAIRRSSGLPVTLEVLEGVGHMLPTESPASLRAVVEEGLG